MRVDRRSPLLLTAAVLLLLPLALGSCAARRTPDLARIFAAAREKKGKRPVIIIPGVLGSQLVNRKTGEIVWPSVFRSSDDDLNLPITPDPATSRDDLRAVRVLNTARFARFAPEVYIYHELLDTLTRYGGYREGDWDRPPADGDRDTFYVFAYDWRLDNVETARELVRRLEDLKLKLNRPDLRFNLLAHSMGGLIARYAAMYGDADLPPEEHEARPTWAGAASINKIFMFATPNEGTFEAFATLLDGYSLTDGPRPRVRFLNKLSRDDVVTAPAMFQLLPHAGTERFLDQELRPLAVDLYDPAVWRRYGWSIFADPVREGERGAEEAKARALFFAALLRRARLFHRALDAGEAGADSPPVQYFVFGGDCEETLAAPVLLPDAKRPGRWITLTRAQKIRTAGGRHIGRAEVERAMFAPGDGRVTRASLLGENLAGRRRASLFNTGLSLSYAVFACDLHGDLPNNKIIQDNALTLLISEALQ